MAQRSGVGVQARASVKVGISGSGGCVSSAFLLVIGPSEFGWRSEARSSKDQSIQTKQEHSTYEWLALAWGWSWSTFTPASVAARSL